MQVTRRSRIRLRLQNVAFVALFAAAIGLLGWLSGRYEYEADWTSSGRNTLAEPSRTLLARLEGPVYVTAFAREDELLRRRIEGLIGRYQREKPDFELQFVNPDREPERVRELDVTMNGELVVRYQGRSEKIQQHSEQELTNALQRLARGGERRIVFLTGHGERAPKGQANHDLGILGRELERKGLVLDTVNLAEQGAVPPDASVLVIAGPEVALLPGEVELIRRWVAGGGNLLWLADPGPLHGLEPLAEALGVAFLPGVVVDADTSLYGIPDPSFVLVPRYPPEVAITRSFDALTLYPRAAALELDPPEGWSSQPFLRSVARTWTETGALEGEIRFDEDTEERPGPLTIGAALTRPAPEQKPAEEPQAGAPADRPASAPEQRVAVIGDGDFLANAYAGNAGNLDLGLALVHWLTHDDVLIDIPAKTAPDRGLALTRTQAAVIAIGFQFAVPLLLLAAGLGIWYRRTRR